MQQENSVSDSEEGEDEEITSEEEEGAYTSDDIANMTLEEAFYKRPKIPKKYIRLGGGIGVGTRRSYF